MRVKGNSACGWHTCCSSNRSGGSRIGLGGSVIGPTSNVASIVDGAITRNAIGLERESGYFRHVLGHLDLPEDVKFQHLEGLSFKSAVHLPSSVVITSHVCNVGQVYKFKVSPPRCSYSDGLFVTPCCPFVPGRSRFVPGCSSGSAPWRFQARFFVRFPFVHSAFWYRLNAFAASRALSYDVTQAYFHTQSCAGEACRLSGGGQKS